MGRTRVVSTSCDTSTGCYPLTPPPLPSPTAWPVPPTLWPADALERRGGEAALGVGSHRRKGRQPIHIHTN